MNTYAKIIEFFVKRKRKMGWSSAGDNFIRTNRYKVPECTMSAWYEEARNLHDLGGHYDVFRDCVENEITYDRAAFSRQHKLKLKKLYRKYHLNDKNINSFCKKPYHKKKELSEKEILKKEWKKKKKDRRDQGNRWSYSKCKKFFCRKGNKAERRFVKSKLKSKNWQESFENPWDSWVNKDKKEFVNIWDWD